MALSWKHVVPWANRSEFVQTYLDLYSKSPERQWQAVETISLWKCRANNKLSVAIESSAALTEAYLLYQKALGEWGLQSKYSIVRSMMTLAMIRFVNHVTEKGQNKAFAQPVHKIADEFGIPEWIVRLRHDGSHGQIPCLDMLSRGVQWALTYLQEVFWSQQVKEADEVRDPGTRKRKRPGKSLYSTEEIRGLLQNYQKASYKSLGEGPDSEAAREEKRALRRIEHILNGQQRNNVLRCLVESGHLLPTEQQLRSYHVNLDETFRAESPKVPEVLINIWKGLLRLLQEKVLTSLLLQHMVTSMLQEADDSSLQGVMLLAWLRLVLLYETSNYSKTSDERESQPTLYSSAVEFSKDLLLATCVQNPGILTCQLLRLVDTGTFSEDTFRKLEELEDVYKGRARGRDSASVDKAHSDEETETREEEESVRKGADSQHKLTVAAASEDSPWKLCTDPVDWEYVPIGVLPSEVSGAGTGSGGEHHAHDYSSTSDDEDGRSSEDEPDTTTFDPVAQDTRERSPKKPKEDILKDIRVH